MGETLQYYWQAFTPLDQFIWGLAIILVVFHIITLFYYIYRNYWKLDPLAQVERWRIMLLSFTEILPLLGLLGTVIALLNTFYGLGRSETPDLQEMIVTFAPALTTTISGLLGAIINLFLNSVLGLLQTLHQNKEGQ